MTHVSETTIADTFLPPPPDVINDITGLNGLNGIQNAFNEMEVRIDDMQN